MKALIIVDMQNDFITGTLGTPEAVVARDNLCKWMQANLSAEDLIIFTQDTHFDDYLLTQEGKNLPVIHCISDTEGWEIDSKILEEAYSVTTKVKFISKETFGAKKICNYLPISRFDINEVIICGVCTDICVVSNALIVKAGYFLDVPISVLSKCCAGTTPENHRKALDVMQSCQITVKE